MDDSDYESKSENLVFIDWINNDGYQEGEEDYVGNM